MLCYCLMKLIFYLNNVTSWQKHHCICVSHVPNVETLRTISQNDVTLGFCMTSQYHSRQIHRKQQGRGDRSMGVFKSNSLCFSPETQVRNKMIYGLSQKKPQVFSHPWGDSPIIFTRDCVTRENHWWLTSLEVKNIEINGTPYVILNLISSTFLLVSPFTKNTV